MMKNFMDKDFLLESDTAKTLYHNYSENLPIIDYHCHINPQEIAEDRHFENITQVWLGGDHYKWRLMRSAGISEDLITGSASDHDKFVAYARALERSIGNPLYHWSHLELQKYFNYYGSLTSESAEFVWNQANEILHDYSFGARGIMQRSNVELICTTDDPADDLHFHELIAADNSFNISVLPAWRPDKAVKISAPDYKDYIEKLGNSANVSISSFNDLIAALARRMSYFNDHGCKVSDHGLGLVAYRPASNAEVERIFNKALSGSHVSDDECLKFQSAVLVALAAGYSKLDWVMQLHYGVKRDVNHSIYKSLGADAGVDCIDDNTPSAELADFLSKLEENKILPKTILYSLNPSDNSAIGTIIGCFQDSSAAAKVQHGAAWWFNDHKKGMIDQMTTLAALGCLGNFVGMLTDSRSFLSYTRHHYFRRIMCNLIGGWVENGEYPANIDYVGSLVSDISYNNCKKYFNF